MDNKYKLTINGKQFFEFNDENLLQIDALQLDNNHFHVLKNNVPYTATVVEKNFLSKKYTIEINGNTYFIDISNSLDLLIKDMGIATGSSKQVNVVKAPMPGLILDIEIEIGQEVKENQALLILEAMKMENTILSPRAGVIKTIKVSKGQAVDKGHLMIEFE